jgi:hypothetical protein
MEETVNLPFNAPTKGSPMQQQQQQPRDTNFQKNEQTNFLTEKVVQQGNKVLEIAPIVIALAHNWWQWIYLENQYYSSFASYILSANFLMWLLFLAAGASLGLFALKRGQNKGFAISSLVILSVNLLLFLVPKR